MEGTGFRIAVCLLFSAQGFVQARTSEAVKNTNDCAKDESAVRTNTTHRLQLLRRQMVFHGYQAYIVTSNDEHQSEYVADSDKRRQYITGFTGSAGTAVILQEHEAGLWTDSRYYIQADLEMDCNWQLMPTEEKMTPRITEWLAEKLDSGSRVGADARLVFQPQWESWSEELAKNGLELVSHAANLIDNIWMVGERPAEPARKVNIHDIKFAGKSWEEKVRDIRVKLIEKNVKSLLVVSLTEVAWLFNLRGFDIPYVPVFKAFALVMQNNVKLYIKKKKLSHDISEHLNEKKCLLTSSSCINVNIEEYKDIYSDLSKDLKGLTVLLPNTVSHGLYSMLRKELVTFGRSPVLEEMVTKNIVERKGMENAMLRDSVALIAFLARLESEVQDGKVWDEMKAAEEVQKYRSEQEYYKGESFKAISAVGDHAALPHYSVQASTNRIIDTHHIYLLDSGGQYLDGTTDITRTLHFGVPSDFQKEAYTRVLMGVISLATIVFPEGTKDTEVDVFSRQALYQNGLSFGHGTGHGVGSYLSVHEFPPRVRAARSQEDGYPFKLGMFFSIEPGFYLRNEFGIRLETIFTVVEAKTKYKFENMSFYTFEPVVWIPFEKNLITKELLSKEQVRWLDNYHAKCVSLAGQRLRRARHDQGLEWLMSRAKPVKDWTNKASGLKVSPLLMVVILLAIACQ